MIHGNYSPYLGMMLQRHVRWSEPTQFFAFFLRGTSVTIFENWYPQLVGLEFDLDSSSEIEMINVRRHKPANESREKNATYQEGLLSSWRYGCFRMKSRSPPLASSFGHRLPSSARSCAAASGDGAVAVGHYALTSNTKPSRRADVRSPVGMQTLSRTLLTRRSQSLAARSVRSRLNTVGDGRCGRGRSLCPHLQH